MKNARKASCDNAHFSLLPLKMDPHEFARRVKREIRLERFGGRFVTRLVCARLSATSSNERTKSESKIYVIRDRRSARDENSITLAVFDERSSGELYSICGD